MTAFVPILMGSQSDMNHAKAIMAVLDALDIGYEVRIGSAHKTPKHVLALIEAWEADPRQKAYITIAGRSNALSAFVDMQTTSPVISCPPVSSAFGGADIYSSLRMPGAVAPAVVLEPGNAALLAGKILGLTDPAIEARVKAYQQNAADVVIASDEAITHEAK